MIRTLRLTALLLLVPTMLAAQDDDEEFCPKGRTQLDMNACAADEWAVADSVLNDTYQAVIRIIEPERVEALREAQRAWVRFRDAECEFQASQFGGGSIVPMVELLCRADLTRKRIADFDAVLNEGSDDHG